MASESMDLIGDLATLLQNQFNGEEFKFKNEHRQEALHTSVFTLF